MMAIFRFVQCLALSLFFCCSTANSTNGSFSGLVPTTSKTMIQLVKPFEFSVGDQKYMLTSGVYPAAYEDEGGIYYTRLGNSLASDQKSSDSTSELVTVIWECGIYVPTDPAAATLMYISEFRRVEFKIPKEPKTSPKLETKSTNAPLIVNTTVVSREPNTSALAMARWVRGDFKSLEANVAMLRKFIKPISP